MLKAEIYYHNLKFLVPGGTSRGILHNKPTWYIKIFHSNNTNLYGMGECGPINGLSLDDYKEIPNKLKEVVKNINDISKIDLSQFPSIQFAYEIALKDF